MIKRSVLWNGVELNSEFKESLFDEIPMDWTDGDMQKAFHSKEFGSITIVDRMTGFGGGIRDIETGYRDSNGEFWLASGNFNILSEGTKTVGEAIELIKKNANTCIGKTFPYKSNEEKLKKENELLREALETIVHKTNHVPYSSDDSSMMIYESCEIAKNILEKTK